MKPQQGGFFYFTGVVAKQVARDGFSGKIKLCLNLNEVKKQPLSV
jgi:Na+-translocating ferredoxin:NAD+ oxidoreductase RnfG subunit